MYEKKNVLSKLNKYMKRALCHLVNYFNSKNKDIEKSAYRS